MRNQEQQCKSMCQGVSFYVVAFVLAFALEMAVLTASFFAARLVYDALIAVL